MLEFCLCSCSSRLTRSWILFLYLEFLLIIWSKNKNKETQQKWWQGCLKRWCNLPPLLFSSTRLAHPAHARGTTEVEVHILQPSWHHTTRGCSDLEYTAQKGRSTWLDSRIQELTIWNNWRLTQQQHPWVDTLGLHTPVPFFLLLILSTFHSNLWLGIFGELLRHGWSGILKWIVFYLVNHICSHSPSMLLWKDFITFNICHLGAGETAPHLRGDLSSVPSTSIR